jgi:hypothetical protein
MLFMNVSKPRVVVTHWVHPEVAAYLNDFCDAVIPAREEGTRSRPEVAARAAEAEGLIACMADTVDEDFLSGCLELRVVSAALKGYDNFDAEACARRGVWLTVVPDTIIAPTADSGRGSCTTTRGASTPGPSGRCRCLTAARSGPGLGRGRGGDRERAGGRPEGFGPAG